MNNYRKSNECRVNEKTDALIKKVEDLLKQKQMKQKQMGSRAV